MENFEDAAVSRLSDWEILSQKQHKVGAIHFGGIYIECLLKGIICCKYHVTDGATNGKWDVDGIERTRPSHGLTAPAYRQLLSDLYDDMPDEVFDALECVSCPGSANESYIDYRYIPEDEVTDVFYDNWLDNFISVFDYLEQKKHEV